MNRLRDHRWWLRRLPAIVVAVALLVLLGRNADTPALPDYEVPEGFTPAPPPTTAAPGAERPALLAVAGTTTTVPPNVGRARIAGVVLGPDGPVPGATVRIERVVLGTTQTLDLLTGADGRYDAASIGGGRYRVRAFLPPTLAQPAGEVFYLRFDEERVADLTVEAFAEPAVSVAVAPNPPLLGQEVNIGVRVTGRFVDADGFVRTQPLVGATVEVSTTGGWSSPSPSSATTDGTGQATFASFCESTTPAQLFVTVRIPTAPVGDPPLTRSIELPTCVDPATLTTTTTTSTTLPGGSSSTSSSTTTTTTG